MSDTRIQNLELALNSLDEYVAEPVTNKRDAAGLVFGFVLAFDLAWKCAQDKIAELGYPERGPKPAIGAALKAGLIADSEEAVWARMLEDRNVASHTYNPSFAEEVSKRIVGSYAVTLRGLFKKLTT